MLYGLVQLLMSALLSLDMGLTELLVVAGVGLVVIGLALLPAYALYSLGHPIQAVFCGLVSVTGPGLLIGVIWVIAVAQWDRSRDQQGRLPDVPE